MFSSSQEKREYVNNNSSEQVLYVDPVITEIEVFLPEEHKPTHSKKEKNTGSLDTRDYLQKSLLTNATVVYIPNLNTGYKPQISNFLTGENHLSNNDETASSTLKPSVDSIDLGKNAQFKKYPNFAFSVSSVTSLSNTLLEELSLILNQGECSPPDLQNSTEEETTMLLENASPSETIPEQTLLPDEFVSCLGIMNEELPSINSYFPQDILESHFNKISLLEK